MDLVSAKRAKVNQSGGPTDWPVHNNDQDIVTMDYAHEGDDLLASELWQPAASNADDKPQEEQEEPDKAPDRHLEHIVVGFVTSEAPKGLSGRAGARALCSLSVLRQLYQEQVRTNVLRNSQHGIVVHVKSCGSSQCWKAALHHTDSMPWHRMLNI